MAGTEPKKQRRQPTKLTIKSRPLNEPHPREWGETVKVPKAKLDALVEEYKRLHDENWKYDIAAKRTAKSNMSRKTARDRNNKSIRRMLGKKWGRPDRAVPFVSALLPGVGQEDSCLRSRLLALRERRPSLPLRGVR